MALSEDDKSVLEEIVTTEGNCMNSLRCRRCPFRAICLPEFLNPNTPPTSNQRLKMAQDILAHHYLIDEESDIQDHKWDKK